MKKLSVGDKFIIRDEEYITCLIDGLYYFINTSTGKTWTHGLEYDYALHEINVCGFNRR